jgi:Family of unknown function (DUF6081)
VVVRRSAILLCVALALMLPAGGEANGKRTLRLLDDFSRGAAGYERKWQIFFSLEQQFGAQDLPAFSRGRLRLRAVPFRGWIDDAADHVKYDALSRKAFRVPRRGSVTVSADIRADTSGIQPRPVVAGRRLPEAHQAAAVLQVVEPTTLQVLDWFVASRQAIPKIERTPAPVGTVGLDRAYTQFLPSIRIRPGRFHRFAIRYSRGRGRRDKAEWLVDGRRVAVVRDVGVPLDVQDRKLRGEVTFPSQGPGERLESSMNRVNVGHGLFSFVDRFPFFSVYSEQFVSIPQEQRIFGQGVDVLFDSFRIETVADARGR